MDCKTVIEKNDRQSSRENITGRMLQNLAQKLAGFLQKFQLTPIIL